MVDGTYELFRHYFAVPTAADVNGREIGAGQEISIIRIVQTERFGVPPVQVALLHFLDIGHVFAEHVFQPAHGFHATLLGRLKHLRENVEIAVVRSACVLEHRVLVVLRVGVAKLPPWNLRSYSWMPIIFAGTAAHVVWDAARETPALTADWRKLLRLTSESDMVLLLPPFVAAGVDVRAIDPRSAVKVLVTHHGHSRVRAGMDRRRI